jgi:hypothetical protein
MTRSWRFLLTLALVGAMGILLAACTSPVGGDSEGGGNAGVEPPADGSASDDTASDDTASDDTASDDTASDDTASDDTASDDTDPLDTTPPGEISDLDAVAGENEVSLSWNEPGDGDFAEVRISWTPTDGEAQPVTVSAGTPSYKVTGLLNATIYTFTVVTVDDAGNVSAGVEIDEQPDIIIEDTIPPGLVSNLSADPGNGQMSLSWDDPDDADLARIEVLWDPDGLTPQVVAVGTEEYTATGLDNGTEYTFVVRSFDTSDNVSGVDILATPTPPDTTPPAEVTGLSASPGDGEVTLAWTEPGDGDFAEVRISWTPPDGGTQPVAVPAGTTTNTIGGLTYEYDYTFTVVTVDAEGNPSAGESVVASPLSTSDTVSIVISFDNPQEPTFAFTDLPLGEVDEKQVVTVEATAGFSDYEWLIDGIDSAALSVSGPTDNTAEIDTGEVGLGTRTLTLIVDGMYSAQTSFTVVQP